MVFRLDYPAHHASNLDDSFFCLKGADTAVMDFHLAMREHTDFILYPTSHLTIVSRVCPENVHLISMTVNPAASSMN